MFSVKKLKRCLVIAEVSANHGQKFDVAVKMIREAKRCGADAVKFQTYTADTITLKSDSKYFQIGHTKWKGQTLHQLYQKAYTPWSWFSKLKKIADSEGILFFSAAFDPTAVDLLEEINVPMHKIASFELVDIPLIEYMAKTGKPVIMSTGMASLQEIKEAVSAARNAGARETVLLKCVSSYPAEPKEMNLRAIPDLIKRFRCPVGLSDHSMGPTAAVVAVALGAKMVEKHFILSKRMKTADSFFSVTPGEFRDMVEQIRRAEDMLGEASYGMNGEELRNRIFRRSLFVTKDIKKGERFTPENVRSIRPAHGLSPKYLSRILGKRAAANVKRATPLKENFVSSLKIS